MSLDTEHLHTDRSVTKLRGSRSNLTMQSVCANRANFDQQYTVQYKLRVEPSRMHLGKPFPDRHEDIEADDVCSPRFCESAWPSCKGLYRGGRNRFPPTLIQYHVFSGSSSSRDSPDAELPVSAQSERSRSIHFTISVKPDPVFESRR